MNGYEEQQIDIIIYGCGNGCYDLAIVLWGSGCDLRLRHRYRHHGYGGCFRSRYAGRRRAGRRCGCGVSPEQSKTLSSHSRKRMPVFRVSAGARFTITLERGKVSPALLKAARILSRLSFTAVSASPTISKHGVPLLTSVSTSTLNAFRPNRPRLFTFANIILFLL